MITANSVRLVAQDGFRTTNLSAGRLEILINNTWGTVCSVMDRFAPAIACRQLGYFDTVGVAQAVSLGSVSK